MKALCICGLYLLCNNILLFSQIDPGSSLEGIIVEKYFTVTKGKRNSENGTLLSRGMITYRIFVDMKPGCVLEAVYGTPGHPLSINTSTAFYNNVQLGAETGNFIDNKELNLKEVALDSWLTIGGAARGYWGIPTSKDTDGSILNWMKGSESDGLQSGEIPSLIVYGLSLDIFKNFGGKSSFQIDNGAWAVFGGAKGPTEENVVLIAQITTDGELTFELNMQIGTPDCEIVEQYVARNPLGNEIQSDLLIFPGKVMITNASDMKDQRIIQSSISP